MQKEQREVKRKMANDHDEHPLMKDIRHMRNFDGSAPLEDVYRAEVARFALRSPHDRAADLMDLDQRVSKIEESEQIGLRQKAQIHRYRSHLANAHATLKKAGR
jgi:hypothetical protein